MQEPFGRGQKGSSAMPHKRNPVVAERICGLARVVRAYALVGLENVALWHERDISHSSAERVVIPDAFLALDYMLDRFAWLVEGLVVRPERMRRNLEASHYLFFSQRVLNALVEAGLARDDAYRLVQRASMRAWEEELDFRELCRADDEIASRVDLDADLRPRRRTRATSTPSSPVSNALKEEPAACLRLQHSRPGRSARSTRSTTSSLLLVASDRISTFDVVLPTEIPDKGRVLTGLSGYWFTLLEPIVPNHMLAIRDDGRSMECRRLEMLPIECVVRGYLAGSGWKDYSGERRGLRARAARGPARVGQAARADLHACDEGDRGPRREHHARAGGGARRRGAVPRGRGGLAPSLHDRRRPRAARPGSSSPTRSSSWGSTPTATSCSATRR